MSEYELTTSNKFKRILEAATDGIVILDREGLYTYANAAAERILGVNRTQIVNRSYNEAEWKLTTLKGDSLADDEMPFVRALQENKAVFNLKCIVGRPDGRNVVVSTNAAPFYTETGHFDGVIGVLTDVTEEYELQERNTAFLHTVAHDLRSPLTTILGYAEVLRQYLPGTATDTTALQYVDEIIKSSEKMEKMISDLLDSARIEGGTVTVQKERIVLVDFIKNLSTKSVQKTMDASRLSIELPQDLSDVLADPDHLERILVNLINNAMKFSPVESKVIIRGEKTHRQEVKLFVVDRGRGISPEDFSRLFRRFAQVRGKHSPDSVGLGLYITRLLVEANGGRIWVESKLGHGSTFNFTLPIADKNTK